MNDAFNKQLIEGHEGLELKVYKDSLGNPTIGRGCNLRAVGARQFCLAAGLDYDTVMAGASITLAQADALFDAQYANVARLARLAFPAIDSFPQQAAAVICDMIFELGYAGFMGFKEAVADAKAGNWLGFAAEIQNSLLARQVPSRVASNVALLEEIPA